MVRLPAFWPWTSVVWDPFTIATIVQCVFFFPTWTQMQGLKAEMQNYPKAWHMKFYFPILDFEFDSTLQHGCSTVLASLAVCIWGEKLGFSLETSNGVLSMRINFYLLLSLFKWKCIAFPCTFCPTWQLVHVSSSGLICTSTSDVWVCREKSCCIVF